MERLQGPINPCIFGDHQNLDCLEPAHTVDFGYGAGWGPIFNAESLRFGESQLHNWVSFCNPNLLDSSKAFHEGMPNISFLQMLEEARSPPPSPFFSTEPNVNMLSRFQQKRDYLTEMDSRIQAMELESCITHVSEAHSPVKSETNKDRNPHTSRGADEVASSANQEPYSPEICKTRTSGSSAWLPNPTPQPTKPSARERRKRKRSQPSKNSEEVESQRMTHIAVERNRRKQMNEHLNALRSLMPNSFIQRGDQASIIGGAIDFVKELEQLLQSLQAQKRKRQSENGCSPDSSTPFNGFFLSPQYTTYSSPCNFKCLLDNYIDQGGNEFTAENKSAVADIEVTLIQNHANLKVLSRRRPGQLLKAITALENLNLAILHLNITSLEHTVLYSFNLKIEEDCKLGSADEIATAVHQIFTLINGN